MATTRALEDKTVRLPGVRKALHTGRALGSLTWVWIELWAPMSLVVAGLAISDRVWIRVPLLLVAVLYLIRARGELAKNVRDTVAVVVRWRWHNRELTNPIYPHLHRITITELALRYPIPAKQVELTVRPNPHQGDPKWTAAFADHIKRALRFSEARHQADPGDLNLVRFTLVGQTIPDRLEAS